jgi:hypothetical protein
MNIFVLDLDPVKAAIQQCDKHIVKMPLETAQMLSTINGGPYRPTHINHPCTLWANAFLDNYNWLVKHGLALCSEYTYRYKKVHKCEEVIRSLSQPLIDIPEGFSQFVQCMPNEYKCEDPVQAYRAYYHSKRSFTTWLNRNKPDWWKDEEKRVFTNLPPRGTSGTSAMHIKVSPVRA